MGAGVGRPHAPTLERQPREHDPDRAAALRPQVLPVSRQRARQRCPQSGLSGHVRVHQRLRGAPTRTVRSIARRTGCWSPRASEARAGWSASRPATIWAWRAWRSPISGPWSTCGRTRPPNSAGIPMGPGVREPGRRDGRLQPASPRPDLGGLGAADRRGTRGCHAARVRPPASPPDAARLRHAGAGRAEGGRGGC